MKIILKAGMLVAFILMSHFVAGQTSAYDKDLAKLLSINGSTETYNMVFDQLLVQLKPMNQSAPDSVWKQLKLEVFDQEVNELTKKLVPLYKQHFTHDDVKELISFYESPIGKKLITETPQISQESMAMTQNWSMDLMSKLYDWLAKEGN